MLNLNYLFVIINFKKKFLSQFPLRSHLKCLILIQTLRRLIMLIIENMTCFLFEVKCFCTFLFYCDAFQLFDFHQEELEDALLSDNPNEIHPFLQELLISLLSGLTRLHVK